jgi:dTDP-4-amino-4,6-dideoxygalactose transaminase
MLVTDDEGFAARARKLAAQAREPVSHYEHAEVGFNYRLSNLLAAVGRGQLPLLEDRIRARRENFRFYADALSHHPLDGKAACVYLRPYALNNDSAPLVATVHDALTKNGLACVQLPNCTREARPEQMKTRTNCTSQAWHVRLAGLRK